MDQDPISPDKIFLDESTNITIGAETMEYRSWDYGSTLILIQLYKRYYDKIGSYNVKSLKKMWEIISQCFINEYNLNYSPKHCENRWRVLERSYRKYLIVNKTTRMRRHFEYAAEMESLCKNKKYIPEVLLNSTSTSQQIKNENLLENSDSSSSSMSVLMNKNETSKVTPSTSVRFTPNHNSTLNSGQMLHKKLKKNSLEAIRIQFKNYHSQKIELKKQELEELKRSNNILEEKNQILKQYLLYKLDLLLDE